jgi:hypothetical protein
MARRAHTYAIRLAVDGVGQVKAELVSVGQSGEQSLKRVESAGERASGGLKGLGRQAELLRAGVRTLGVALAGVTTVGGLAALVDRSISAADAIGKTADKIGVGVEALQELRFAAKASGFEQQTLDMALQRFTRRAAEAAPGTGEAKDALAQMGIALRDQSGNLRRSEEPARRCSRCVRAQHVSAGSGNDHSQCLAAVELCRRAASRDGCCCLEVAVVRCTCIAPSEDSPCAPSGFFEPSRSGRSCWRRSGSRSPTSGPGCSPKRSRRPS